MNSSTVLKVVTLAAGVMAVVVVLYLFNGRDGAEERKAAGEPPGEHTSPRESTGNALAELSPPESSTGTTPPEDSSPQQSDPNGGSTAEEEPDPVETDPVETDPVETVPEEEGGPSSETVSGDKNPPPEYAYAPDPLGRRAGAEGGSGSKGESGSPDGSPDGSPGGPALDYSGMELLASEFIASAYGYTGGDAPGDAEEYYSGLDYSVVKSAYEKSPGGELLLKNQRLLAEGDRQGESQDERQGEAPEVRSAAKLESVEYVREVPWEELSDVVPAEGRAPAFEVVLRYTTGEDWSYGDGESELSGPTTTYEQRVVMLEWTIASSGERAEGGWKLVRGELPTEVSNS